MRIAGVKPPPVLAVTDVVEVPAGGHQQPVARQHHSGSKLLPVVLRVLGTVPDWPPVLPHFHDGALGHLEAKRVQDRSGAYSGWKNALS